jgi:hypothetical protein
MLGLVDKVLEHEPFVLDVMYGKTQRLYRGLIRDWKSVKDIKTRANKQEFKMFNYEPCDWGNHTIAREYSYRGELVDKKSSKASKTTTTSNTKKSSTLGLGSLVVVSNPKLASCGYVGSVVSMNKGANTVKVVFTNGKTLNLLPSNLKLKDALEPAFHVMSKKKKTPKKKEVKSPLLNKWVKVLRGVYGEYMGKVVKVDPSGNLLVKKGRVAGGMHSGGHKSNICDCYWYASHNCKELSFDEVIKEKYEVEFEYRYDVETKRVKGTIVYDDRSGHLRYLFKSYHKVDGFHTGVNVRGCDGERGRYYWISSDRINSITKVER